MKKIIAETLKVTARDKNGILFRFTAFGLWVGGGFFGGEIKMQIITKKVSELKHTKKNVRLHDDKQIKEYIRSVEMFGQIRPLVIDENNVVICGNGLLQAFQQMGKETAECYIVSNLTEKQKKKLMLADNKIYELGTTDAQTLDDVLRDLAGDIDIPGYDPELLKSLAEGAITADNFVNDHGDDRKHFIDGGREISPKEFADDNFDCTCPRCGFKFNV